MSALAPVAAAVVAPISFSAPAPTGIEYGKKNPFPGETLDTLVLNGEGSAKETVHLEFSLSGSGLAYEPGDALAVIPVTLPTPSRRCCKRPN